MSSRHETIYFHKCLALAFKFKIMTGFVKSIRNYSASPVLRYVQGTTSDCDFVPLEQCFKRRHSRRKTNVFLKSPHLNLASKDFKEAK